MKTENNRSDEYLNTSNDNQSLNQNTKRNGVRGFAAMSPEKQREIAREGGRAAHIQGTAHQWTSEEARVAGRKGGQARGNKNSGNENQSSVA